ncbi:hypothetical protein KM043_017533 [Ampulex compressa]|nr:hypothetical protein KM043_017533 [Ampulex compressa]
MNKESYDNTVILHQSKNNANNDGTKEETEDDSRREADVEQEEVDQGRNLNDHNEQLHREVTMEEEQDRVLPDRIKLRPPIRYEAVVAEYLIPNTYEKAIGGSKAVLWIHANEGELPARHQQNMVHCTKIFKRKND